MPVLWPTLVILLLDYLLRTIYKQIINLHTMDYFPSKKSELRRINIKTWVNLKHYAE